MRTKNLNAEKSNSAALIAHYIQTPIGVMIGIHTKIGVCLLEFVDRKMLETELKDIQVKTQSDFLFGMNSDTERLEKQLTEYFTGQRKVFDVPLDFIGTDFQRKIWSLLLEIPYGEILSYKDQAIQYGDVNSIRAIAGANGKNKISIIVPCHRVIGSNGELVGYGGGLERKRSLLHHEKAL